MIFRNRFQQIKRTPHIWFILAFVMVIAIPCAYWTFHYININQRQAQESQFVAAKVSLVMNYFNCQDPEIHTAIMKTFDPVLVAIVVGIESDYKVNAVSPRGCRGLMQLSPGKLDDWRNKTRNIQIGAAYLQSLLKRFDNTELAIAAYNAGPDAVIRYGGAPPFRETQRYLEKARLYTLMVKSVVCYETGLFGMKQPVQIGQATL